VRTDGTLLDSFSELSTRDGFTCMALSTRFIGKCNIRLQKSVMLLLPCTLQQVVMAPNGMILMIWGPCSCRHNDLYSLDKSGVLDKWMKAMPTGHQIYLLYGDSIYPWRPGLRSRHGAPVGDLHKQDVAMSSCRQLIENGFGLADTEFPYLSTPSSMKIMSGMPIKELYFCKMYLTNLLLCLYEGQTSLRFACSPPALEDYVAGV
jgi:hypothetical protein